MKLYRFRSLIFACISICLGALSYVGSTIVLAIRDLPLILDAKTFLALNRLTAPVVVLADMRSRFVSFVKRALAHDEYRSGYFDPGRATA